MTATASEFQLPRADRRRCTACGICLTVCPTACLTMPQHVPVVTTPAACVQCGICVSICPVEAFDWAAVRW